MNMKERFTAAYAYFFKTTKAMAGRIYKTAAADFVSLIIKRYEDISKEVAA